MATPDDAPPPLLLAFFVAQAIRRDPVSHTCSALGLFHAIAVDGFPHREAFDFYLAVSEVPSGCKVVVRLLDPEDATLTSIDWVMDKTHPLEFQELDGSFGWVTFPRRGVYRIQASCGGDVIAERKVRVFEHGRPIR